MKVIWICISIMGLIIAGAVVEDKRSREQALEIKQNIIQPPLQKVSLIDTDTFYRPRLRAYNYKDGVWLYYSDQHIRNLREVQSFNSNGNYIYTPGRHVPSEEEIIENYIEENIDEILDKYAN